MTCKGTGEIDIPETLLQTLCIVEKLGQATSGDVHNHGDFKDRITLSAVSNRLDDLHKAGLVTRIKDGSAWLYTASEQPKRKG